MRRCGRSRHVRVGHDAKGGRGSFLGSIEGSHGRGLGAAGRLCRNRIAMALGRRTSRCGKPCGSFSRPQLLKADGALPRITKIKE